MPKAYIFRINDFHRSNVAETERLAHFHHRFGRLARHMLLSNAESTFYTQFKSAILASALAVFANSAFAHQYDPNKPVTLTGTVQKIEWRTPYVKIHLDATDANGSTKDWEIQTATPRVLQSDGMTRTSVKEGDQITVQGYQDTNGSDHALAHSITLADGQTVAIGTSGPSASTPQASQPAGAIPQTATNWPLIGLMGLGALGAWSLLSIPRRLRG